jgi:hypothetical protein
MAILVVSVRLACRHQSRASSFPIFWVFLRGTVGYGPIMQERLRVGDTLDFTTSLADYPASAGWVLTYRLIPRVSGTPISIVGTASGDDHRTSAVASTTATWAAGEYSWVAYVDLSGEHYVVDEGAVTLLPNLATSTAYDSRSMAEVALADAREALANYQSSGGKVKRYSIGGREMEFADSGGILKEISYWQIEVTREYAAKQVAKGLADPRRIYLRAGRA